MAVRIRERPVSSSWQNRRTSAGRMSALQLIPLAASLSAIEGVAGVEPPTQNSTADFTTVIRTRVTASDNADLCGLLGQIVNVATAQGCSVLSVTTNDSNLERLFLELTGRRLRD